MNKEEHFCTLFDLSYLPYGLCLKKSLDKHIPNHILWILCMDNAVYKALTALSLPKIKLIELEEIESQPILKIKSSRTKGEYCWTLTPFLPVHILNNHPSTERVTYLDADLYFFENPNTLISELEDSTASVLITEHAYAPQYDQTETSGRFCVQFLTFLNNSKAKEILHWWQNRCLEWCFARLENGLFGDQMYLNQWPELFGKHVKIVTQKEKTQAPWNADYYYPQKPVFYHFHGFKLLGPDRVRWFLGYQIKKSRALYEHYYTSFLDSIKQIQRLNIEIAAPQKATIWEELNNWKRTILGKTVIRRFKI